MELADCFDSQNDLESGCKIKIESLVEKFEKLTARHKGQLADYYNDDNQYKLLFMEAIEMKMKLEAEYYLELQAASDAKHLSATFDDFFKGPEALIGVPNPKIWSGMHDEHCLRGNATTWFTTGNYNMTTTPRLEWEFVVSPTPGFEYPHTPSNKALWRRGSEWQGEFGRDVESLQSFLEKSEVKRAALIDEEVIALRLATGPMFVLYNAVLRNFPEKDVECLLDTKTGKENRYETTIFVIASGISKLSKLSGVPKDRRLYRGLDAVLPRQFREDFNECQVTVELTANRKSTDDAQTLRLLSRRVMAGNKALGSEFEIGKANHEVTNGGHGTEKYLKLDLSLEFGVAAVQGVRVVKEAHLNEDAVQMTIALPFSKFRFLGRMKESFIHSLESICPDCKVIIDESSVSNKPKKFRGAGVKT